MTPPYLIQSLREAGRLYGAGSFAQAERLCRMILTRQPDQPDALHLLALLAMRVGRSADAAALLHRVVALKPESADAFGHLGTALADTGHLCEAITALQRSILLNPNSAESFYNLGDVYKSTGRLDEAIGALRQAIALRPDWAEAYSNLGLALKDAGQLPEATRICRQALALAPHSAEIHHNLALLLLLQKQFTEGWDEYEWRSPVPPGIKPWDGTADLANRSFLILIEQGLGDSIQFIRYITLLAERGAVVTVAGCPRELTRLIRHVNGVHHLLGPTDPLPATDFCCRLLSLPRAFGTIDQTIPRSIPYIAADAGEVDLWRAKMRPGQERMKVGLAWAGNPKNRHDQQRSIPVQNLAPLLNRADVDFYSLQKGPARWDATKAPPGLAMIDLTDDLHDLADTAALIANLDLVISVDTAVAHLAGAMGKRTWILLPFVPDWRWQLDREDSDWYPSLRLFRQPAAGNWEAVIMAACQSLQADA
jgi:Flp pilus assembly protein TadD